MNACPILLAVLALTAPFQGSKTTLSGQSTLDYFQSKWDRRQGVFLYSGGD